MPRDFHREYLSSESGAAVYDADYYRTGYGSRSYEHTDFWLQFFGAIADAIVARLNPKTVFDAGCGPMAFLVESLRDRGVDASGVDISSFAIEKVRDDIRPYCRVASIASSPIPGRFDLIICIEVLEHLSPDEATRAIANLTAATDVILFSSTPSDFNEPTHINVQPPIAWITQFAAFSFVPDLVFDTSFLTPHAMLLRRKPQPLPYEVQALFSDVILLKSAISRQSPDVPPPAQVSEGHLLRDAYTKSVESMRLAGQLAAFVETNNEMGRVIDDLTDVNRDLRKRIGALERKNSPAAAFLNSPPTEEEEKHLRSLFYPDFYTGKYTDIQSSGIDPFSHFMQYGAPEGRIPHPLFDTPFYLSHNPELVDSGVNPVLHFLRIGANEGCNPHPLFDTVFYLDKYADVRKAGVNPLVHFVRDGAAEARDPHPFFKTSDYLAANPDVEASGINALLHFVLSGAAEGRLLRLPIEPELPYALRISRIEPGEQALRMQEIVSGQFLIQPVISIIVPVYRVSLKILKSMIDSVRAQTYPRWELCLAHGYPEDEEARTYLRSLATEDSRIKVEILPENLGISGNSNRALHLATGDFVGLLDHDDTLASFALFEVVKVINEKPAVDFIYSDKDSLNEHGERISPLFKPQWSPDLMLSANYLTHFCVMRMEHVRAVHGWREETNGAQDWDLFFRVIERSTQIEFIDKVLYHWGIVETSVASGGLKSKLYALKSQIKTISGRLARIGGKGTPTVQPNGAIRIAWDTDVPSVSIILVSDHPAAKLLERARELQAGLPQSPVEIIVAAPYIEEAMEPEKARAPIVAIPTPPDATLAQRLNAAAAAATGWALIFLDDSVQPDAGWLPDLLGPLQLDNVAMVSPMLLDPKTQRVRHAGIVFNREGDPDYIFAGHSEHAYSVFGGPSWCRNWSAVAGACFSIRRSVFHQVGAFSETPGYSRPGYPRLDIDLCLRITVLERWRIFYNAFARYPQSRPALLEAPLNSNVQAARDYARRHFPLGDPFFHPRLDCRGGNISFAFGTEKPIPVIDYAAEARALTSYFDFSPQDLIAPRGNACGNAPAATDKLTEIAWFLPEFTHPFYGGIHTILRVADYLQRAHQVRSTFLTPCPGAVVRSLVREAFPALAADCGLIEFTSADQLPSLPYFDAAISTLWTTAYPVLKLQNARRKFCFMQDYESLFYPAGSISALVEATYHFGFSAICNTISLRDIYKERGGEADYFNPCVDLSIFNADSRTPRHDGDPYTLFCYARPTHPRNCFELLGEGLRIVKKRFGDDIRIVTAGADWSPRQYGLDGIVHNMGLLGYRSTGALYRSCTAGVAMMMTCHPSYLPFELMASGSLVIANTNPHNRWLLKDRENCLIAENSPTSLADAIEEGLRNQSLREELVANAARMIETQYSDWDKESERIYRYMVRAT